MEKILNILNMLAVVIVFPATVGVATIGLMALGGHWMIMLFAGSIAATISIVNTARNF